MALIINIFVMLAEERKGELGIMRAIGLPRGNLMELILFEGVIYVVIAAALGSMIGIGVGAAITYGFNYIFVNLGTTLSVRYTASMVFEAFLIGMIVTLATIALRPSGLAGSTSSRPYETLRRRATGGGAPELSRRARCSWCSALCSTLCSTLWQGQTCSSK